MAERDSPSHAVPAPPSDLDQALQELAALHAQLDSLRQELVWSNRLTTLGTLAAVLAHEYNNLLTPVGTYAQLALANPCDEDLTRKALENAVQGAAKAQALAEATLGFARPEDAEQPSECELREAIDQALACVGGAVKAEGIELEIDVPMARLRMRSLEVQQVLVNLMQNACRAMAGQRKTRRLSLTGRVAHGTLILMIRDTGPGIPNAVIKRLFEPFVTHATGPGDSPGTGLGLRVCKDLVESAGGTIRAETQAGEGAVFRLELPTSDR